MSVSERVIEIIRHNAGALKEEISHKTLIEDDLGVTGDDAWELMEEIQKKFDVNMDNFNFSLHFGPEAGFYVDKQYGYYPVSVQHLIDVAKEKKWKLPEKDEEHYHRLRSQRKKKMNIMIIWWLIVIGIAVFLAIISPSREGSC